MTGLFSKLRSIFNNKSGPTPTSKEAPTANPKETEKPALITPQNFDTNALNEQFYQAMLGQKDDGASISQQQKLIIQHVEKHLKHSETRIKSVPRLPTIIPKLLQSLRNPDSSANDYVNIVNKDPSLSTAVMKLANSARYSPSGNTVETIDAAVVKLGIEGLRSVLSLTVMQPLIQRRSFYYSDFGHNIWKHSVCCAMACEIIAKQRGLEPFKAYLSGLVHDIGKITIFNELSNQFQKHQEGDPPSYATFTELMSSLSKPLSHQIAEDWSLPEEICESLKEQDGFSQADSTNPYALTLFHANLACEIYAVTQSDDSQQDALLQIVQQMDVPENLFETLDAYCADL